MELTFFSTLMLDMAGIGHRWLWALDMKIFNLYGTEQDRLYFQGDK